MNIIKNKTMKELTGITQSEQNFRDLHQELIDLKMHSFADRIAAAFYANATERFQAGIDTASNIYQKN